MILEKKLENEKFRSQNILNEELQATHVSMVEEIFPDSKWTNFIADLGRRREVTKSFISQ